MLIIPAIDIRAGSVVRLTRGDPKHETVYSSDPVKMAHVWEEMGAKRLHVVDLDGAFGGNPHHLELVGKMKKETDLEIEFGGGLRDRETVKKALDQGIDKLILGTAALEGQEWVRSALEWQPERFIVGLDALNNQVAKEGWQEDGAFTIDQALAKMEMIGFRETIYTDISKDGMLEGPNLESVARVVKQTRMGVYASGGVSSMEDIRQLRKIPGLRGAIVGKALYAGKISLEECFKET